MQSPNPQIMRRRFAMIAPILIALWGASAGMLTVPSGARAQQAVAQDAALFKKLAELTKRKGYKNLAIGYLVCVNLGIRNYGKDCNVYQAPYPDDKGYIHAFNVFEEPNTRSIHLIIFKRKTSTRDTDVYLTSFEGKLHAAASVRFVPGDKRWSKISPSSPQAQSGFAAEIAFWRIRQTELEGEPDRKD